MNTDSRFFTFYVSHTARTRQQLRWPWTLWSVKTKAHMDNMRTTEHHNSPLTVFLSHTNTFAASGPLIRRMIILSCIWLWLSHSSVWPGLVVCGVDCVTPSVHIDSAHHMPALHTRISSVINNNKTQTWVTQLALIKLDWETEIWPIFTLYSCESYGCRYFSSQTISVSVSPSLCLLSFAPLFDPHPGYSVQGGFLAPFRIQHSSRGWKRPFIHSLKFIFSILQVFL